MIHSLRTSRFSRWVWVGLVLSLGLLVGCSSDGSNSEDGATTPTIDAPAGVNAAGADLVLEVVDGGEVTGLIITDHRGFAVYGTTGETADNLICLNDCTRIWMPLPADRGTVVADRLDADQFGLVARPDGSVQVSYAGVPLYLWTGDDTVGLTKGAGVAGTWFALTESGGFIE